MCRVLPTSPILLLPIPKAAISFLGWKKTKRKHCINRTHFIISSWHFYHDQTNTGLFHNKYIFIFQNISVDLAAVNSVPEILDRYWQGNTAEISADLWNQEWWTCLECPWRQIVSGETWRIQKGQKRGQGGADTCRSDESIRCIPSSLNGFFKSSVNLGVTFVKKLNRLFSHVPLRIHIKEHLSEIMKVIITQRNMKSEEWSATRTRTAMMGCRQNAAHCSLLPCTLCLLFRLYRSTVLIPACSY